MTQGALAPTILILAAGASVRMRGRDKLLEPVRGKPLLTERVHAASLAIASPADVAAGARVIVTLPPRDVAPARWAALAGTTAALVGVNDHRSGMSASLRAGVATLPPDCPGLMVLPADMPDITAEDISALIRVFDGDSILRGASVGGRPGHPVLFPARDFTALAALRGDLGGRDILEAAGDRLTLVSLPGDHALTDLDTPEDWDRWRRAQT